MGTPGKVTNYPNGLSSFGTVLGVSPGAGGRIVLHVCNRTGMPAGDGSTRDNPLSTLFGASGALAKMQNNTDGGVIYVWPGHAENIDAADKASDIGTATNVAVVGIGSITSRPTFTWTTATSTWLFDTAGFSIENCNLYLDPGTGTVTVAAPITISAGGCAIRNCYIRVGTDANSIVTNGITTTAAGDDLTIEDCYIYGAATSTITSALKLVGADRHVLRRVRINTGTSGVAVGPVLFATTASTGFLWEDVIIKNSIANSTCAVIGLAGIEGQCRNLTLCTLANDDLVHAWITSFGSVQFGPNCGIVNNVGETPGLIGAASA